MRAAAAELPHVGLEAALRVCLVLASAERDRYEPLAVRWLGRLLLEERGVTLAEAQLAPRRSRRSSDRGARRRH